MRFLIPFAGMLVVVTAPVRSQQAAHAASPFDRTVTLTLEGAPLKDALDAVARQTGVRIAYSGRVVPLDRPVSVQLAAVRVEAALDTLLHGTGVASTLDGTGQILLVADRSVGRAVQQSGSISGTVRDSTTGAPVADAVVTVVGTVFTAKTGADGRFAIAGVPAGGYRGGGRMLGDSPAAASGTGQDGEQAGADVQLARRAIELNPVVAVGYGAVEKRDLTGAVASVNADQFETKAAPTVTLSSGLQGKVAGVQVTSNSGMPGVGIQVRVRGTGSITANSEPLYVIDGLPAEQGAGGNNDAARDPKTNPLMSLDPNEIESIDILKDASATAIYGARGANGVVLITTKRGQAGTSQFTVESSVGFQNIAKTIPVLNAPQFMRLTDEAILNAGGDSTKAGEFHAAQIASAVTYNYPAMMLRTGLQANQGISLSGGDQKLRYLISGNFTRQQGIEIGSDFNRYSVRLNLDGDAGSRFRWGSSLSMTRVARNAARVENGSLGNSANGIQAAMQFAPFQAPKDSAGNWIKTSPSTEPVPNPIANALEETDLNTTSRLLGSVFGELALSPSLKLKGTLGGNFQFDGIHFFAPRTILDGGNSGSGWMYTSQGRNLTSENTVSYTRSVGPGALDILGGFSVQTWYTESVEANAAGFPTDFTNVYNLGSGSQLYPPSSGVSEHALISYLGRANYNIADKYLFTLTGRRDGSSVFGANHKWGFFPSGAFAWRVGDEQFMRGQSLFSDLKLRLSYGTVGNQAVNPYQSLSQLSVGWVASGATEIPAMTLSSLMPNPDLHWEQKTEFNAGLDGALLDNRVAFSLDVYRSKTKDLLLLMNVPVTTGYSRQLQNVGSIQNNGVELSLTTANVSRPNLNRRSTLTLSHHGNKVLDLGTRPDTSGKPVAITQFTVTPRTGNFFDAGDVYLVRVGEPLGAIYGYQVTGLWQKGDTGAACYMTNPADCTPGEYKIADLAGGGAEGDRPDGKITSADRTIPGNSQPHFYGGVSNH